MNSPSPSHQWIVEDVAEPSDFRWRGLYAVGGVAAMITAAPIPIHVLVFIIWPPPLDGGVAEWFTLFQDNWLLGLVSMDLLLMDDYVLLVPIVLALFVALRRTSETVVTLAAALFFVAIAAYFASNPAFEMLSLSKEFETATTDSEKEMYLAAGQAMLSTYAGTAFHVNYVLGSVAGILIGIGMLRSRVFSRSAAYAVLLGNVIGLGLYLPTIGLVLSVITGQVLWIWYILIGRRLLQLGRDAGSAPVERYREGAHPRVVA